MDTFVCRRFVCLSWSRHNDFERKMHLYLPMREIFGLAQCLFHVVYRLRSNSSCLIVSHFNAQLLFH